MLEEELKIIENLKPMVEEYKKLSIKFNILEQSINRLCRIIVCDALKRPHDYIDGIERKLEVKVCSSTLECVLYEDGYTIYEFSILKNGIVVNIQDYTEWRQKND